MIPSIPVLRVNGERNAPLFALRPPLREMWKVRGGLAPLIDGQRHHAVVSYIEGKARGIAALDLDSGRPKWFAAQKKPAVHRPLALWNGIIVASTAARTLALLDADTGAIIRDIKGGPIDITGEVAALCDNVVVVQGRHTTCAVELPAGRVIWSQSAPYRPPDQLVFNTEAFCSTACLVVTGFTDGTVRALSVQTGREIWRVNVAGARLDPHTGTPVGRMRGIPCIHGDTVIFSAAFDSVICLALADGAQCWSQDATCGNHGGYLAGDRYHGVSGGHTGSGEYIVLEPSTGQILIRAKLDVPKKLIRAHVDSPADVVVTQTHIIGGTGQEAILAYEREGGKCVWSGRHNSTALHRLGGLVLTDDYLLACDEGWVTCLSGQGAGHGLRNHASEREAEAGLLPFEIVSVEETTVCLCRTRDPNRAPFSLLVGSKIGLTVATSNDGESLLRSFRRWFPVVPAARFGKPEQVADPMFFEDRQSYEGDWTRASWFADNEEIGGLSVYFSVAQGIGYFEEIDDQRRHPILARIAALVHRLP